MEHKIVINYPGGIEKLANDLGNLRYDVLSDFLDMLARKLAFDAGRDLGRDRKLLAECLYCASRNIGNSCCNVFDAWKICEPFTKEI